MKKRILSIALCLIMLCSLLPISAMAAETYKIWVGGVQITSDNAENVTGDGISGKVSYDAATKTLTLENATITGVYDFNTTFHDVAGIYAEMAITIRLIGENTVTSAFQGGSSYGIFIRYQQLNFSGDGHLTVTAADAPGYWSVGIYNGSDGFTMKESCSLTAYCSTNANVTDAVSNNLRHVTFPESYVAIAGKNHDGSDASVVTSRSSGEYYYIKIDRGGAVTLNANGGAIASGDVKYYFSDTGATLPQNVTKEGYIFGGWYDNEDCTGQAVTKIATGDAGAKEYWAKWTAQAPATQPTTQPTTPATQPTTPTTAPTVPTTAPTVPGTEPGETPEPPIEPVEPTGAAPSAPATEPSTTPQGSATQPENNQTGTPDDPQDPPIGLLIGIGLGVVAVIAIAIIAVAAKKKSK